MTREEKILSYMKSSRYIPLTAKELATVIDVPKSDFEEFTDIINSLISEKKIVINKKGKLKAQKDKTILCTFSKIRSGAGFASPLEGGEEIYIPPQDREGALFGDTVSVLITKKASGKNEKAQGRVVQILKRENTEAVGVIHIYGESFFLEPDMGNIDFAVRIKNPSENLKEGDKVLVKILQYPKEGAYAEGSVISLLGKSGDPNAEMLSIAASHGIAADFCSAAKNEAEAIEDKITEESGKDRRDFRNEKIITIDGEDARDLDDAVSVKKEKDGYILSVYIADVSHYVKEGSPLDKSAFARGTSVYFPCMVIPMLPKKLSNGICSLNEGEDRFVLAVTMHIDKNGNVGDYKIENGIIRSLHRMTYTSVTKMLSGDEELCKKYEDILPEVLMMRTLSEILSKKRKKRGSIDFDIPEPKIILDEKLSPIAVEPYESGVSNKIIEEFMLCANETVAKYAKDRDLPFVYRIHEAPSSDKIEQLNAFLISRGINTLKASKSITPAELCRLIDDVSERDDADIISEWALRAMMKAKYAPENLGHFGLAAADYCHFTSPIRRYPDLCIHRILKESLRGEISKERKKALESFVYDASVRSSETEKNAVEAEREADKYFICLYMKQFIGCEFDAAISSVTDFGMFVSVNSAIEGMISFNALTDDYYDYDERHYCIIGRHSKKVYKIGDNIKVKLVRSSETERKLDFIPAGAQITNKKEIKPPKKQSDIKKQKKRSKEHTKRFVSKKSKKRR